MIHLFSRDFRQEVVFIRKVWVFLCAVLLISSLAATVFATEASGMNATANVASDGSCQISLALTLRVDGATDKLYFPLPADASGIRVNGSRVTSAKEGDIQNINLSRFVKGVNGDVSVNIQYALHGLVTETEIGTLQLQLPLLSGFGYTISDMEFTVNLPGEIKSSPSFTSGYHQAAIEQHLSYTVEGNAISGNALKAMKDHETLVMTLPVEESMFSRAVVQTESAAAAWIGMGVCAGLALVYWLIFLRFLPLRQRHTEAPEGFTAGQMGCILGCGGVDLTLTVFSWAQLGYILIQTDRRGKVLLHKRMDMGNERSEAEQRVFRNLFSGRKTLDATAGRYAELSSQLGARPAGVRELYRKHSGNPLMVRVLCAGAGMFAGGGIGAVMGNGAALQWFLIILMGALGALSGYVIPTWTDSGLFRNKHRLFTGLGLCVVWVILGLIAKIGGLGITMAILLLILGVLFGWSGLRTDLGKVTAGQILGLRHYLRGKDKSQLSHARQMDPDYFFRMAPYAMALGVGKAFAKAMGPEKPDRCPYLSTGTNGHMYASHWMEELELTAAAMDARKQSRYVEKFLKLLQRIRKP